MLLVLEGVFLDLIPGSDVDIDHVVLEVVEDLGGESGWVGDYRAKVDGSLLLA